MADAIVKENGRGWNRRRMTLAQVVGIIVGITAIIAFVIGVLGMAQAQGAWAATIENKIDKSDEITTLKLDNITKEVTEIKRDLKQHLMGGIR